MASESAIRAGGAFVELFTKDGALVRGLRAAHRKVVAWGRSVSAVGQSIFKIGASVTAPLLASVVAFAKAGDQLDKMSARTGVAVETLSALKFAAEQSGASVDLLEMAFKELSKKVDDFQRGTGEGKAALEALGITADQLAGKNPEEQFLLIADALSRVSDASSRAAYAQKIFGESGTKLLPLMASGAAGIRELTAEAERLGIVMTGEQAANAAKFSDAWNRVWSQFRQVVIEIGAALAPALVSIADLLKQIIRPVIDWARANPELAKTIFYAGTAIAGFGVAVFILGQIITSVGVILGAFATVVGLVAGAISALATPTGAVLLALGGISAALIKFTDTGGKLAAETIDLLAEKFENLKTVVVATWGGIMKAIEAGRLDLALKAAGVGLEIVWLETVDALKTTWDRFSGEMKKGILSFVTATLKRFGDLGSGLKVLWVTITSNIKIAFLRMFEAVANLIANKVGSILSSVASALEDIPGAGDIASKLQGAADTLQAIKGNATSARVAAEKERDQKIDRIGAEKNARDKRLDEAERLARNAIDADNALKRLPRLEEIAAKRRELEGVLKEIDQLKAEQAKKNANLDGLVGDSLTGALQGMAADAAGNARKKAERAVGSFSAEVINRTSFDAGKDTQSKQLAVAEQSKKVLERIARDVRDSALVWGS